MWFFKKKKKETDKNPIIEENQEETVEEVIEEKEPEVVIEIPIEERRNRITALFNRVTRKVDDIKKEYYIQKFFSIGCIKDNEGIIAFANLSSDLENLFDEVVGLCEKMSYLHTLSSTELDDMFSCLEEIFQKINSFEGTLHEMKNKYFSKLLISSASPFMNKSIKDLEQFDEKLFRFLCDYKDLDDAADRIYLDSGELITKMINYLVKYLSTSKDASVTSKFNYNYFLESSIVLAMSISEWISLYNKVTYSIKKVKDGETSAYLSFLKLFNEFELRYIVLMIQEEGRRVK